MKKVLLALVMVLCMVGIAQAEFEIPNLNLSGDTAFLARAGFCAGAGTDVLSYKEDLLTLRGEVLWPVNTDRTGQNIIPSVAIMLDVVKALGYTDFNWKLGPIKPKIGPLVGVSFQDKKVDGGVLLQLIKAEW